MSGNQPPISVHPQELNSQAGNLDNEANDLHKFLGSAIPGDGFAGNDKYAQTFLHGTAGHPGYLANHANVVTEVNALVQAYHQTAGGLRQMAANHETGDWNVAVTLPKVTG